MSRFGDMADATIGATPIEWRELPARHIKKAHQELRRITDRHKLRHLVDDKGDEKLRDIQVDRELAFTSCATPKVVADSFPTIIRGALPLH